MLADLDELLLTVRDPESRTYLREALISFRGGAYRAAIVSVWIAVVYDIISKVRILASQGDKAADALVKSIDNAIAIHDLKTLLRLEDSMLDEAKDKFQLLNNLEYEDLERIKSDRHRCAHPAFSNDGLLFNPTAETVRAHIVHSIKHMLGNPPVQGKSAIENVLKNISSLSFPRNQDSVDIFMNSSCLDYARESLVTSLVSIIVKALLRKDNPILQGHEDASMMALNAIAKRHVGIYEEKMRENLTRVGATLDDTTITNVFPVLNIEPRAWQWFDETTRMRAEGLTNNYVFGSGEDEKILDALNVEQLRGGLLGKLRELTPDERLEVISKNPRVELIDDAMELFEKAKNFRDAEPRGRIVLLNMGHLLSRAQVRRAIKAVPSNYEIWNASQMPSILKTFFDVVKEHFGQTKEDWALMVNELMKRILDESPSTKRAYLGFISKLETAGLGPFDWEAAANELKADREREAAEREPADF